MYSNIERKKNPVKEEYCTQQICSSEMKKEIENISKQTKLKEFSTRRPAVQDFLQEFHQAEINA